MLAFHIYALILVPLSFGVLELIFLNDLASLVGAAVIALLGSVVAGWLHMVVERP